MPYLWLVVYYSQKKKEKHPNNMQSYFFTLKGTHWLQAVLHQVWLPVCNLTAKTQGNNTLKST